MEFLKPELLPKVSAVMPIFNSQKTLKRAVDSLIIQPEIDQIILVDDGSTDGSWEIAQEYAEKNPSIIALCHPNHENRGAPASRNLGLAQVRNPWIQFMDADDQLLPGKIAEQLGCITGEESLIVGYFTVMSKKKEVVKPRKDIWIGLLTTRLGITIANLWNTYWVKAAGGWDDSLPNVQEYHLMFEMLKLNPKVSFSSENLTRVFPQPNSITNSPKKKKKKRDTYFHYRKAIRKYLIQEGMFNFLRRHYYTISTGDMLRYHQPGFKVPFNNSYYWVYKNLRTLGK